MASQIDFAVAVALFVSFIAVLVVYVVNYTVSYSSLVTSSELRGVAYNFFNSLFGDKGIPANWENASTQPVKYGLIGDLYRIPIFVTDRSGSTRALTINATLSLDFYCQQKAWNDSVRVYNDTEELAFQLFNQTFCDTRFLNTTDIAFNITSAASQQQIVYVYFSSDTNVDNTTYNVSFSSPTNVETVVFPVETISSSLASKVNAFRNKTINDVIKTLSTDYQLNIRISKS